MATITRRVPVLVGWLLGMGLISWRYLWQTTPLHRREERVHEDPRPSPALAEHLLDQRCQPAEAGVGVLFHRRFSVRVEDGSREVTELMAAVKDDLNSAAPTEVVTFRKTRGGFDRMRTGDEFVVRMPGPWNGPIRVVECDELHFRFVTLRGHLEAGQIEFRVSPEEGAVRFEIEAWARPSSALVNVLYARLRLAKEMQLNMWVRYCLGVAKLAGGRARGGVTIHTRCVESAVPTA